MAIKAEMQGKQQRKLAYRDSVIIYYITVKKFIFTIIYYKNGNDKCYVEKEKLYEN